MKPTIPGIATLMGKTKGELQAIFRKALERADATPGPQAEAARKTIAILRRCLTMKP